MSCLYCGGDNCGGSGGGPSMCEDSGSDPTDRPTSPYKYDSSGMPYSVPQPQARIRATMILPSPGQPQPAPPAQVPWPGEPEPKPEPKDPDWNHLGLIVPIDE